MIEEEKKQSRMLGRSKTRQITAETPVTSRSIGTLQQRCETEAGDNLKNAKNVFLRRKKEFVSKSKYKIRYHSTSNTSIF